jgi:SpoVK/Ycf46/Vps4 family AAA+-type ATPase
MVHLTLDVPPLPERTALWKQNVPSLDEEQATQLSGRFAIPGGIVVMAARAAMAERLPEEGPPAVTDLDRAVASQLHDRIQRLGRRIDAHFDLEDLVVDDDTRDTLKEIIAAVRERRHVHEKWGLRGAPGVSVLFSGDPGVGKTMSATVLSRRLGLAIYEVDLSQVVSKWVGETEKNLADVFEAAEPGHVVLLFNEADSLFGKRTTEMKSANDRYANLEVNYLLQRLERFGGLAILTTNLGKAIDQAFRRRFAYDVQFQFPTVEMREELWRRAIPKQARVGAIDYAALAKRFELSGGFIKVAIERAAYLASAAGEPIADELVILTVERMYRERGKLAPIGKLES